MNQLPKKKKWTTSRWKKELDKLFSIYIRLKYAKNGQVSCYTCGRRDDWRSLQCGHFVSRSHLATRFDEKNCRPQCVGCNVFARGRVAVFATKLEKETKGIVQKLYKKAQEITKYYPYEEKVEYYKEKIKELIN